MAQLLKGSLYLPLQRSDLGGYTEDTCLLRCCSATQDPVSIKTQALLFKLLNFNFWRSTSSTPQSRHEQRRTMVELAAATAFSPQATGATRETLERMVPSVDSHKVIRMWRILARPVTNLRILSQVAQRLSNFRTITFICISAPAPVRLQSCQIPTIQQAWENLELPKGRIPPALVRKNQAFEAGCRSNLITHCEIQLLMRYESQPSLCPTLAYFGCSKKMCYLCELLLVLSSFEVHTRGRHGQCHPLWAVQPCNTEDTKRRLKSLCETIKVKIRERIEPRQTPPPVAIQQSSAVSDLKSLDFLELRLQKKNREVEDKKAQELRENRQIL